MAGCALDLTEHTEHTGSTEDTCSEEQYQYLESGTVNTINQCESEGNHILTKYWYFQTSQ